MLRGMSFCTVSDNKKSTSENIELVHTSVEPTAPGASSDVDGMVEDDPMCMHTTVPVSSQARNSGSQ